MNFAKKLLENTANLRGFTGDSDPDQYWALMRYHWHTEMTENLGKIDTFEPPFGNLYSLAFTFTGLAP
jgi:hypothetical protein